MIDPRDTEVLVAIENWLGAVVRREVTGEYGIFNPVVEAERNKLIELFYGEDDE